MRSPTESEWYLTGRSVLRILGKDPSLLSWLPLGYFTYETTFPKSESNISTPRSHGLVVRIVAIKQEDLGSIPAQTKWFSSIFGYKEVGIKWIQT